MGDDDKVGFVLIMIVVLVDKFDRLVNGRDVEILSETTITNNSNMCINFIPYILKIITSRALIRSHDVYSCTV